MLSKSKDGLKAVYYNSKELALDHKKKEYDPIKMQMA